MRRGDTAFFEQVAASLGQEPGVCAVRVNPSTASILVEHESDEATVFAASRAQRLFHASASAPRKAAPFGPTRSQSSAAIFASPLDVAAVGLAGAGLLQLLRGQVVGSASENLWNAYGLYAVTRRPLPSALLVAFGLLQIARGQVLGSATSLFLYAFSAMRLAQHRPGGNAI